MNTIGGGLIDAVQLASLVEDVDSLITDTTTATTITFGARSARVFDAATGSVGYSDTATPCAAFLGPLSYTQKGSPLAQEGDVQVLISIAELATAPTPGAKFTTATAAYAVYASTTGPLSTHHIVLAHRAE